MIVEKILEVYPDAGQDISDGRIVVRDDSDGEGEYLYKWDVSYPRPDGLKIGK